MYCNENIKLVPFTKEYLEKYHSWRNDMDIMQFDQPGFLYPISYDEAASWHEKINSYNNSHSFIIKDKKSDEAIGICAFMNMDYKNRNVELSIVLGEKKFWGKGYGKQVMDLMIKLGFEEFNMHKLILRVMSFNDRAIRLYEKLGFEKEGTLKETIYRNGKYFDTIYFGLLKNNERLNKISLEN